LDRAQHGRQQLRKSAGERQAILTLATTIGALEPRTKSTPLQPPRSQEIQTRDWTDDAKGLHDFLEAVMSGPGPAPRPDDWEKTYLPAGAALEAIWVAGDQWRLTYEGEIGVGSFSQLYEFAWAICKRQAK